MKALLYPRVKEHASLEYGWEGYSEVTVFSTHDEIALVVLWYKQLGFDIIDHSGAPTSIQLHLREKGSQENFAELLAVDTHEEESVSDLTSYIGSGRLEGFVEAGAETIGALFVCAKQPNMSRRPTADRSCAERPDSVEWEEGSY